MIIVTFEFMNIVVLKELELDSKISILKLSGLVVLS